jgi:predicted kinase
MAKRYNNDMSRDQSQLIIISGLPGAGKTSLAKALHRQLDAIHLNTDMIRAELEKKGRYDPQTKALIYEELRRRVAQILGHGKRVIIDATFYQQEFRVPFIELAGRCNAQLCWIELEAADAVIRDRVSKKRADSEADYAVYQKIKKAYEPLTISHLLLSSGEKSVEKLVEEVMAYL